LLTQAVEALAPGGEYQVLVEGAAQATMMMPWGQYVPDGHMAQTLPSKDGKGKKPSRHGVYMVATQWAAAEEPAGAYVLAAHGEGSTAPTGQ
jgi:hypothetical protein